MSFFTNPIKSWPSWFEVKADESYWQKEYRSGSIELGAYDRDDAEERADMGKKAREWPVKNFSVESIGKKVEAFLD